MTAPAFPTSFDTIFFDLDGTLWDHLTASSAAIEAICAEIGADAASFREHYKTITLDLIKEIEAQRITVEESRIVRFERILEAIGRDATEFDLPDLARRYLEIYLNHRGEFDRASDVLEAAASMATVGILTNAARETQHPKIAQLRARKLVRHVLTTDETDCLKPHPRFFELAERAAGCTDPSRVLMVGDSWENDVYAPHQRGYWTVWISEEAQPPEPLERLLVIGHIGELLPYLSGGRPAEPEVS